MQKHRIAFVIAGLSLATGCMMVPPTPSQKLTEVARDTNLAARFGRMDMALENTADGARDHFSSRRSEWGNDVRVVDVELSGLKMTDTDKATVLVDYQWVRMDEGVLRSTRVEQRWEIPEEHGGWFLVGEKRLEGDFGLFGDRVATVHPVARGDVHFPSKTIR